LARKSATAKPKTRSGLGIELDPAQQRFFLDDSRVQVVCWHRQKGKDFTAAAKAVFDAIESGEAWYIISLTQRQADETFDKCRFWADRFKQAIESFTSSGIEVDPVTLDEFRFTARELRFPGGGKVVSLPGRNPDTLAGFTGNVIFTEFGLFPEGGYKHWRVVFPLTTRGFRVVVISTPRGRNTKFFELARDRETYSVHWCDIHQSLKEGFKLKYEDKQVTLEKFRELYGDEAGFRREFELEFTGDLDALIKWGQLATAGELGRDLPFDVIEISRDTGFGQLKIDELEEGRYEIGWDVARRRDLSAVWINHAMPGGIRSLRSLVLMRDCTFELQRQVIRSAMRMSRTVGCGDATGIGMDSNETLRGLFGPRWEGVEFTSKSKAELGSMLATTFDEGGQAIPPIDGEFKYIATDIYAIQKETSGPSERLKLVESDNPLLHESHCDIAYAGALALKAGTLNSMNIGAIRL